MSFYGQNLPNVPSINVPQPAQFPNYQNQNWTNPQNNIPKVPNAMDMFLGNQTDEQKRIQQQNQRIINEVQQNEIRRQQQMQEIYAEINRNNSKISYKLPSFSNVKETEFYYNAFDKLQKADTSNFSVKDINFMIENAFYENKRNKEEFDQIIKQSGDFILSKMRELGYDLNSNSAKNYMLFQFFADTLELKFKKELKHLPFKYDFDDYNGSKDWTKMFVTKLIETGTGQCHSMPLLYLILAEEIKAEAFLSVSPNHTYIRFPDDKGKWFNIELTNGMFSTASYILQSGYIKSEALQNKIYMQNLSKKELLAHFYMDLASGYLHKFGYDEFTNNVIEKALELYPNSIFGNIHKANIETARFEYVVNQLGINPRDNQDLQNIRFYPKAVTMLNSVNSQYNFIDNLGYEHMPEEAYQNWLQSMKEEKQKQNSEKIKDQFKGLIINKIKD